MGINETEKEEKREERIALLKAGCFLGMTLLCSSILVFSIQKDTETVSRLLPWFPAVLAGYVLIGILIMWLYTKPQNQKHRIGAYIKGITVINITMMLLLLGVVSLGTFLPKALRLVFVVNVLVLVVLWVLNYVNLVKLSKELNGHSWQKTKVLLGEPLDHCPKDREEFFWEIEKHCSKNRITLEYVEKNNPAIVKLNGVTNLVSVEHSYSRVGPMYTLRFEEMK